MVRLDVPYIQQSLDFCLPTSMSMVLGYYGFQVDPVIIGSRIKYDEKGRYFDRMARSYLLELGFRGSDRSSTLRNIKRNLGAGIPLIATIRPFHNRRGLHAIVLTGYENELFIHDPAQPELKSVGFDRFLERWDIGEGYTSNYLLLRIVPHLPPDDIRLYIENLPAARIEVERQLREERGFENITT